MDPSPVGALVVVNPGMIVQHGLQATIECPCDDFEQTAQKTNTSIIGILQGVSSFVYESQQGSFHAERHGLM